MKTFFTDHYFHIGSLHYQRGMPCQDYALSGANETNAVAIVSDGCSSGRHTDLGSRIQALTLLGAIRNFTKQEGQSAREIAEQISEKKKLLLLEAKTMLGLSRADMLATSVYAYLSKTGGFLHIEGDGVVALKYRDGSIISYQYVWEDNTPFYPTYTGLDLAQFVETHGGNLESPRLKRKMIEIRNDQVTIEDEKELSLRDGLLGIVEEITEEQMDELEFVLVSTDGASQIENVSWVDAVREFMSYKSLEGEFAKRRMLRALKTYEKDGLRPQDDIGIAVIRILENKEEENADKND